MGSHLRRSDTNEAEGRAGEGRPEVLLTPKLRSLEQRRWTRSSPTGGGPSDYVVTSAVKQSGEDAETQRRRWKHRRSGSRAVARSLNNDFTENAWDYNDRDVEPQRGRTRRRSPPANHETGARPDTQAGEKQAEAAAVKRHRRPAHK